MSLWIQVNLPTQQQQEKKRDRERIFYLKSKEDTTPIIKTIIHMHNELQ